jgi:hypothetical protein
MWFLAGHPDKDIEDVLSSVRYNMTKYQKSWDDAFAKLLMVETPVVRQKLHEMKSFAAHQYLVAILIESYLEERLS